MVYNQAIDFGESFKSKFYYFGPILVCKCELIHLDFSL